MVTSGGASVCVIPKLTILLIEDEDDDKGVVCCLFSLQHKARLEAMMLDLASLRSVREFADSFKTKKL